MKRNMTPELLEEKRQEIYNTLVDPTLSHEQRVTNLSREAENLMNVLDEPEGLDELLRCGIDKRCICNLSEGDAPYRPVHLHRLREVFEDGQRVSPGRPRQGLLRGPHQPDDHVPQHPQHHQLPGVYR